MTSRALFIQHLPKILDFAIDANNHAQQAMPSGSITHLVKRGVDNLLRDHLLRIMLVFARMVHRDYRHLVRRSAD